MIASSLRPLCVAVSMLAPFSSASLSADDLVIPTPRSLEKTAENTRPIVGLRTVLTSFIQRGSLSSSSLDDAYYVPEKTIVDAWLKDPNFAREFKERNVPEASMASIAEAGIEVEKFGWSFPADKYQMSSGASGATDPNAIIAMTKSGLFDLNRKVSLSSTEFSGSVVPLKTGYGDQLAEAYKTVAAIGKKPLYDPTDGWPSPSLLLHKASLPFPISEELGVKLGQATFGKMVFNSADVMGLTVDPSTKATDDIYLFEFAISLYDLPINDLDEIAFRVSCDNGCTAWEMAPIRIVSKETTESTFKTPEVGFGKVNVGTIYERKITYESIKPEVIAYGLREERFAWSLQGSAIGEGSHIFLAAIGVPQGTKHLQIRRSVAIRTKDGFTVEGGWASSPEFEDTVQLGK